MWYVLIFILFFILLPFFISKIKSNLRNYLGCGIPVLLFLLAILFQNYICISGYNGAVGCDISWLRGLSFFVASIIFTVVYLGFVLRGKRIKKH